MTASIESAAMSAHGYRPAIVAGRYRVAGVLAHAEAGDVVLAVDVKEDREVVLKRVRNPTRNQTTRLRTVHTILSGLRHPSVMDVVGLKEGRLDSWLVSTRVEGSDLLEWWSRLPLEPSARYEERWPHLAPVVRCLLDGLEAMHRLQLAHLDVKPSNIRLDALGRPVLVDMGFGGGLGEEEPDSDDEAALDDWFGYAAPELLDGFSVSNKADQWSLGAVIHHLLTGRRPVPGRTVEELRAGYERGVVQPLRDWRADIPEEIESIVLKMLAWEPEERFSGIAEVKLAFGNLLIDVPPQPYQPWSVSHPPLVGREPFESFFRRRLIELERDGVGGLIRVVAPAGAGKTRLLEQWERQASAYNGVDCSRASCRPGWARAVLSEWFHPPEIDIQAPPPKDIVDQALAVLDGPTVLLLDALEEVDAVSWARLHRVAGIASEGSTPLLVVMAGRGLPDLSPRVSRDAARFFNVELPPLNAGAVAMLLRAASPDQEDIQVRDGAAESFCDEADGLPARLVQVFLEDEEQGRLVREGRHWVVRVGAGIDEPAVSARPTMHEQFLAWIEELGGRVEVDALLTCLTMRRTAVVEGLKYAAQADELSFRWVDGRWFAEVHEGAVSAAVQVYSTPETHIRVARWLEANGDGTGLTAERVAKHWHAGGDYTAASIAYRSAGAAEGRIGNTADARRLDAIARTLAARAGGATRPAE